MSKYKQMYIQQNDLVIYGTIFLKKKIIILIMYNFYVYLMQLTGVVYFAQFFHCSPPVFTHVQYLSLKFKLCNIALICYSFLNC